MFETEEGYYIHNTPKPDMNSFPVKETAWGKHIITHNNLEYMDEVYDLLIQSAMETVKRLEDKVKAMGQNAWLMIGRMEYMDKPPINGGIFSCDPFNNSHQIIGWKIQGKGRAFVIDRLKDNKHKKPRHPYKNNVPKRKRGKWMTY